MPAIDFEDSPGSLAKWLAPTLVAVAYFLSAVLGLALSRGSDGIAALWPANGVLLAALLLSPVRRRPAFAIGCFLASMVSNANGGSSWSLAVLLSLANVMTAVTAATIIGGLRSGADAFRSPRGTAIFLFGVTIAASIGAAVGTGAITRFGGGFASAWVSWVSSDILGMILVCSLVLTVQSERRHAGRKRGSSVATIAWPLLLVASVSLGVFAQSRLPLLFLPLAMLVIATYRLGLIGAVAGVAIVAAVGSGFSALGYGPVALIGGDVARRIEFFQFYLAVLYGTCLPLAAMLGERVRLAHERAAADRRYRRILEQSREVIFETDVEGRWTYLNPAWAELTGQDPAVALGSSFLETVEPDDRDAVLARLAELYRGDVEECVQELRFRNLDGDVRWASVRSRVMVDEHGAITGTYGNIHDVTDRRAADDARIDSERRYRLLADNSNDMIVRLSLQGVRRYVSPASYNLLGYTPDEMVGEPAAGALHPDDRAIAVATCNSLLDGVENPMCIYRQRRKDGSYVWLEASYRLIRDADGAPDELIATVRDVSRRETAELERLTATNQLSEANRLLLMAEEMSRVGHWRVDIASGSVFWSDVVCAIHAKPSGYAPRLDAAIEFYHPDDRARVQAAVDDAVTTGKHFAFTARLLRDDGSVRHIVSSGRAETGPDGSVIGLFGVIQDVTEAHDADAALQETGRQLRDSNRMLTMAEAVGKLGHWRIDYATGAILWSDEVYRIYGLPADTIPTADTALAAYHPDDVAAVREAVAHAREHQVGYTSQARLVRGDGATVHIVTRAEVEVDTAGTPTALFGIVQDVSERVAAQAELADNEARFRLLTEQASDVISLHDVAGNCLFMSPSVETILGYSPVWMRGRRLQSLVVADDRAVIARLIGDLTQRARGDVATARFRLKRQDGALVWIEAAARIAEYSHRPRIVVVSRDVSDQVRAEADLAAARDRAEDAVKAKTSFLANMSHEIRTPMNGVVGFTELMLAGELSDEQRRRTEMIAESGRAMMRLLNDILDLSKVEAGQMVISEEPFDLAHTLDACVKLVGPALEKKGLRGRCDLAPDLPDRVCGDALRLRQIVLNLLGNAVKFTKYGTVTLRASRAQGDTIVIAVEDTGIGIAPDRQQAVFDQFVQADGSIAARFGGSGLGLAISARLARLMDGDLRLESEEGRGTTFFLSVPLRPAPEQAAMLAQPTPTIVPVQRTSTRPCVLVAEDHDVNRLLMTEMLDRIGYDCELAHDGAEAVAMVAAGTQRYSVVLMDMRMPGIDGVEATRRIRASGVDAPSLPIVALTANAYADDIAACLDAGMQSHLAKPVSLEDLQAALLHWAATPAAAVAPDAPKANRSIEQRYFARREETLAAVSRLIRTGRFADADIADVVELLHKLAGTAGMFGEVALGDEAYALENGLRSWPPAERSARIKAGYDALQRVAEGER
ncbi:MAG: PAS domain S-box protein [Sphingomonas sp.]|uniref:PAS domain S-box protein n=1 Tax=Sphingomonas sp. TaxID=28214 RepID=UPI001AC6908B|nr:PAS domain S-box protein [Sphingomonas sp.]MBN8808678.1 PAS domain S-box protein [Sphingomonas sp.]